MRIKLTIIAIITAILIAPSFADNAKTTTSKGYVDTQIATKQDKVPAVDTNTVITTTDTPGEIGEKAIYNASGNYAEQADALVTAADANAAVQNAIDTEFVCIEWAPNTTETPENCYIWKIQNLYNQSPNLLNEPSRVVSASFDSQTAIMTSTATDTKNYVQLMIFTGPEATMDMGGPTAIHQGAFQEGELFKKTFTASADANYIMIKHNGSVRDYRVYFKIEPLTTYTVLVKCLGADPTVVGGVKMQLMLVKGEYNSDTIIPYGSVYIPQS